MLVKFIAKSQPYNQGEIAQFPDDIAKKLINSNVAVKYQEEEEKKETKIAIKAPVNRKFLPRVKK